MKRAYKVLSVLSIVFMIAFAFSNVYATTPTMPTLNPNANIGTAGTTITNIGSTILTIVTYVGMILSVIIVAVIGIKYMMESSEGKAEYKKNMIPYIVGAVLVFGASAIGRAVVGFGTSIVG